MLLHFFMASCAPFLRIRAVLTKNQSSQLGTVAWILSWVLFLSWVLDMVRSSSVMVMTALSLQSIQSSIFKLLCAYVKLLLLLCKEIYFSLSLAQILAHTKKGKQSCLPVSDCWETLSKENEVVSDRWRTLPSY